ncbi:MAG: ATP-binding protein [Calditrichia bacterium]
MENNTKQNTVLVLAADPKGDSQSQLEEEIQEIEEGLKRSKLRETYSFQKKVIKDSKDLRRAILDCEPNIIHFCSRGTTQGIMFVDDEENAYRVSPAALASFFQSFAEQIDCVFLNACYATDQAIALNEYIEYVVGFEATEHDSLKTEFAVSFYDALWAGRTFEQAFQLGVSTLKLSGEPIEKLPVLLNRLERFYTNIKIAQNGEISNSQDNFNRNKAQLAVAYNMIPFLREALSKKSQNNKDVICYLNRIEAEIERVVQQETGQRSINPQASLIDVVKVLKALMTRIQFMYAPNLFVRFNNRADQTKIFAVEHRITEAFNNIILSLAQSANSAGEIKVVLQNSVQSVSNTTLLNISISHSGRVPDNKVFETDSDTDFWSISRDSEMSFWYTKKVVEDLQGKVVVANNVSEGRVEFIIQLPIQAKG